MFRPCYKPTGIGLGRWLENGPAAQASGTDLDPAHRAGRLLGPDFLQVGLASALGFVVGVTDIIAYTGFLAAYRTDFSHINLLLAVVYKFLPRLQNAGSQM